MSKTIDTILGSEIEALKSTLGEIEMDVLTSYTLADAIREGAGVTDQSRNWGRTGEACALTAAALAVKARGYAS